MYPKSVIKTCCSSKFPSSEQDIRVWMWEYASDFRECVWIVYTYRQSAQYWYLVNVSRVCVCSSIRRYLYIVLFLQICSNVEIHVQSGLFDRSMLCVCVGLILLWLCILHTFHMCYKFYRSLARFECTMNRRQITHPMYFPSPLDSWRRAFAIVTIFVQLYILDINQQLFVCVVCFRY